MLIAQHFALSGTNLKGNSKSGPEKQKRVSPVLSYLRYLPKNFKLVADANDRRSIY